MNGFVFVRIFVFLPNAHALLRAVTFEIWLSLEPVITEEEEAYF